MAQLVSAPMRLEFCLADHFAVVSNQWNSMVRGERIKNQEAKKHFSSQMNFGSWWWWWPSIMALPCDHVSYIQVCISVPVRFLPVYKAYKVYTLIEGGSCLNPPFRHKMLPGPCDWMYCGGNSIGNGNKPAQAELLIRLPMVLVAATRYLTFNFNFNFKVNFTLKLKL